MLGPWEQLGIVLFASVVLMALLWVIQRRTGDAGIVDVGWSYALAVSAVFVALTGAGDVAHRVAIGLLVVLWGFRLGTHLLTDRILKGAEDGRYQMLRERAGDRVQPVLFAFYQAQALLVPVLSVPFVIAATAQRDGLGAPAISGIGLWVMALVGESIADRQLARFKRRDDVKGKTCREGLWRYSRHPNYFFEWLMWVSYALIALEAPLGWIGLLAPALMLLLVLKVTGIPPTEARALRSRGEDYRDYQRTTSPFVPWPVNTPPFAGRGSIAKAGEALENG